MSADPCRPGVTGLLAEKMKKPDFHDPPSRSLDLFQIACSQRKAATAKVAQAILARVRGEKDGELGVYDLRAVCHAGLGSDPLARKELDGLIERVTTKNIWHCCPWGPFLMARGLWFARDLADVRPALDLALGKFHKAVGPTGCVYDKDPISLIDTTGVVEHPLSRKILERQLPLILRIQRPDGGWGDRSFQVFRALMKHKLLEPLRKLPPLPPDWRVVRSIPAPADKLNSLAWDGTRLWTCRPASGEAFALSPNDGRVLKRLTLPKGATFGVGWWDGALAVTQGKPKRLLALDPDTGKITRRVPLGKVHEVGSVAAIDGTLWVCDCWMPCMWAIDPAKPTTPRYVGLATPGPVHLCAQGNSLWHDDWLVPVLTRSSLKGKPLALGSAPFPIKGLAWDGTRLWALDAKAKRLCVVEKTATP